MHYQKQSGVKALQEYVFTNIYEEALKNEEFKVSLQVFRMILSGIPRAGKTTFWKRLTKYKGFEPSEDSPSTPALEAHTISAYEKETSNVKTQMELEARKSNSESEQKSQEVDKEALSPHLETAMLLDLRLCYDSSDLDDEALTIYRRILKTNEPELVTGDLIQQTTSVVESNSDNQLNSDNNTVEKNTSIDLSSILEKSRTSATLMKESNPHSEYQLESLNENISTNQPNSDPEINLQHDQLETDNKEDALPSSSPILEKSLTVSKEIDPISKEIDRYFEELQTLLKSSKKISGIPLIKMLCCLMDIGGQRAFLQMLPTVTIGKALYLLFFSYEKFKKKNNETVQKADNPEEVCTGTTYEQLEVIMQSLICVSTTSKITSDNVALLVGTHVDKVEPQHVENVNEILHKNVRPFLESNTLVFAESQPIKDKLVLEVSTKPNNRCSDKPEDYQKVIMNLVEKRLKCSESDKLPASWYMFSIMLRRIQIVGHSVLQYHHCQRIANKLHIKPQNLRSLLNRMHRIFGIILYFPEVPELNDIVICDPTIVFKGISELIFNSFDITTHSIPARRLKRWGVFMIRELEEHCKQQEGCQLKLDKLIVLLQHLGIIAPVDIRKSEAVSSVESEQQSDPQYLIPCILDDAQPADLNVQMQEAQACSIIPLRITFSCGFAPMGGFCYLFTRLLTNNRNNGWQLLLPEIFDETMRSKNDIYWRNKVTFKVDGKYFVILLSTSKYYEIHIIHSKSEEPFLLGMEGHYICKKVWNAVSENLTSFFKMSERAYKTAYKCTLHQKLEGYDEHEMVFDHNPDDNPSKVRAVCTQNHTPVIVDDTQQSITVWFKVCMHVY